MSALANGLLDDIGKAIVEQLQEDGRRPYASIGRAVGLSEAAVRQRMQRLPDTGVIPVVAVIDPQQLGFRRQAMIGVTADGELAEAGARQASEPAYFPIRSYAHPAAIDLVAGPAEFDEMEQILRGVLTEAWARL